MPGMQEEAEKGMSVSRIAWSSTEYSQCTGDQPCQRCTTYNTECVYDRSQDGRWHSSRRNAQRKLVSGDEELERPLKRTKI